MIKDLKVRPENIKFLAEDRSSLIYVLVMIFWLCYQNKKQQKPK